MTEEVVQVVGAKTEDSVSWLADAIAERRNGGLTLATAAQRVQEAKSILFDTPEQYIISPNGTVLYVPPGRAVENTTENAYLRETAQEILDMVQNALATGRLTYDELRITPNFNWGSWGDVKRIVIRRGEERGQFEMTLLTQADLDRLAAEEN